MKQLSNKDQKMGGKNNRPHHLNHNICWICHQESNLNGEKEGFEGSSQFFETRSLSFQPCLCKGSIGIVHQECLNAWASERYQTLLKTNPDSQENLPVICCPNCKEPYQYTVFEVIKFKGFKGMKLVSVESFWLFFLLIAQISVLIYDIFFLSKGEEHKRIEENFNDSSETINYIVLSKHLHIFTALIVIAAGVVNLLESVQKQTKVEIHSQS